MKAIALALLATLIATLGQLLLKSGMRQVGPISRVDLSHPFPLLVTVFSNPLILIAIPLYVAGFLTWLIVLSKLDLSYAYPFLAVTYVLVPLLSWLLLGEHVPSMRWIGIAVICVGLVLVGWAK
ncbi:MAG: EamA family transporter [Anaerolineae bacterium]|jgi:drug/metabolite transporter (DMT)-like permease